MHVQAAVQVPDEKQRGFRNRFRSQYTLSLQLLHRRACLLQNGGSVNGADVWGVGVVEQVRVDHAQRGLAAAWVWEKVWERWQGRTGEVCGKAWGVGVVEQVRVDHTQWGLNGAWVWGKVWGQ